MGLNSGKQRNSSLFLDLPQYAIETRLFLPNYLGCFKVNQVLKDF